MRFGWRVMRRMMNRGKARGRLVMYWWVAIGSLLDGTGTYIHRLPTGLGIRYGRLLRRRCGLRIYLDYELSTTTR